MSQSILRTSLTAVTGRLKTLRAELAVVDEQLLFLEDEADSARLRALIAETPLAEAESRECRRHADAMGKQREVFASAIGSLEREQDDLLDRMAAEMAPR